MSQSDVEEILKKKKRWMTGKELQKEVRVARITLYENLRRLVNSDKVEMTVKRVKIPMEREIKFYRYVEENNQKIKTKEKIN